MVLARLCCKAGRIGQADGVVAGVGIRVGPLGCAEVEEGVGGDEFGGGGVVVAGGQAGQAGGVVFDLAEEAQVGEGEVVGAAGAGDRGDRIRPYRVRAGLWIGAGGGLSPSVMLVMLPTPSYV